MQLTNVFNQKENKKVCFKIYRWESFNLKIYDPLNLKQFGLSIVSF